MGGLKDYERGRNDGLALADDMATWEDYRKMVKEEMGIEMVIRYNR